MRLYPLRLCHHRLDLVGRVQGGAAVARDVFYERVYAAPVGQQYVVGRRARPLEPDGHCVAGGQFFYLFDLFQADEPLLLLSRGLRLELVDDGLRYDDLRAV